MAAIDDFDRAAAAVLPLVAGLTPDDLARPTPCAAWNVRALVNHLTFGNRLFAGILRGEPLLPLDELLRVRDIDQLGDDPHAAFQASVDEFRTEFRRPEVAGQTFPTSAGPMPADGVAALRVNELLVHGWDLERALRKPAALPNDLAEQALGLWRERVAAMPRHPGGPFGPEQPVADDAPAIDRLAGLLGRTVD
jgi:uncharacterized protein (TIGR03086 family)